MAMAKNVSEKSVTVKNTGGKGESGMMGTAAAGVNVEQEPDISAGGGARADKAAERAVCSGGTKNTEPVYTAEEFCSDAQELFGVRPECVRAALTEGKVTQCTKAEAHRIVEAFLHKEVK